MIRPTLGRIVWFTPHAAEAMTTETDGRCAAIITKVWSDTMVNLTVFDANGETHAKTSVVLVQEGRPKPQGHFCEWMPYQIKTAQQQETESV